ncbi:DNA-binding winged helix-turn-helix (wHTH) protein [Hoeflea marina]|uniref:DNA-binding winged helix-turn-helix (WHTH) protein n=1 Tax=Hoeflea marina TaxID=274592 RepID=A0A317PQL8_9HYPH|nr:winged helix-turn-helix domain-containing protein [Hoeflea marina]PWW02248.1 DNA-binding winged helix-turn-helix (wHTH) protein [Hoeflea marina]
MQYRFNAFELDTDNFVLSVGNRPVHVEPMVFDLIRCLAEHAGSVVSKEQLIEKVWKRSVVSDATIASCVKAARRALGDDGGAQTCIRTLRGRGFQLKLTPHNAPAARSMQSEPDPASADPVELAASRPRIAVLPLQPMTAEPRLALLGDAVAQEVILELSRLHWLFVISRGSSFKFRGADIDLAEAARVLGVTFLLTGTIVERGTEIVVDVELCHVGQAQVVWAERFSLPTRDLMHVRASLAGQIATALEPRIQSFEATRAIRIPTEHLDAWSAYHRGLWHMYRFTAQDNEQAARMFGQAAKLDPAFARAHAGLSFTHFQNAFLGFTRNSDEEVRRVRRHAERSLELDPLDPFVNLTMGRSEWLSGQPETALSWIDRAISLNPNYAFAIYNSALIGTLFGDGEANDEKVVRAIELSPIDPLNYAMLATRALTRSVRGNHEEAALWADRAAQSPNAHAQIFAIAAFANELIGEREKAMAYARHTRSLNPRYSIADFTTTFTFRDPALLGTIRAALTRLGFAMGS